jgi:hypothetical protein
MGKGRKPPQKISWSFVQADIEKENTHTVNSTFAQHLSRIHINSHEIQQYIASKKQKPQLPKPCRQRNPTAVELGQAWTKKYYSEVAKSCTPAGVATGDIMNPRKQ